MWGVLAADNCVGGGGYLQLMGYLQLGGGYMQMMGVLAAD